MDLELEGAVLVVQFLPGLAAEEADVDGAGQFGLEPPGEHRRRAEGLDVACSSGLVHGGRPDSYGKGLVCLGQYFLFPHYQLTTNK